MARNKAKERIVTVGALATLAFFFSSSVSIALVNIFFSIAAAAALAMLCCDGIEPWHKKAPRGMVWLGLAFVAATVLSIVFSPHPQPGWKFLPAFLVIAVCPLVFLPFAGSALVRRYGMPALQLGLVCSLVLLLLLDPKPEVDSSRLTTYMGVMNYGGALGLSFPMIFSVLFMPQQPGKRWQRFLAVLALACCLAGSALNGTRIIQISIVALALFLFVLHFRSMSKTFKLATTSAALLLVLAVLFYPAGRLRLVSLTANSAAASSNKVRLEMWKDGVGMIPDLPFFGLGLAAAPSVRFDGDYNKIGYNEGAFGHYHNTFLNVLLETGWPGFVFFVSILGLSAFQACKTLAAASAAKRIWAKALLALLAAFSIHCLTDTLFHLKSTMFLFGALLTLCWVWIEPDHTEPAAEL